MLRQKDSKADNKTITFSENKRRRPTNWLKKSKLFEIAVGVLVIFSATGIVPAQSGLNHSVNMLDVSRGSR